VTVSIRAPFPHFLLACLAIAALGACAVNGEKADEAVAMAAASLSGPVWRLDNLNGPDGGVAIPEGVSVTLKIEGQREVSGSAGCNTYFGTCIVADASLQFGPLASTKKACIEPEGVMELERQFLAALGHVTNYAIKGQRLTLLGPEGISLIFHRAAP